MGVGMACLECHLGMSSLVQAGAGCARPCSGARPQGLQIRLNPDAARFCTENSRSGV
jgi:hypothetical protein